MSRLLDQRYRDPTYEAFRDLVEGWIGAGGAESLAVQFEVTEDLVYRWRLGSSAPSPKIRDEVTEWISGKTRVTTFTCLRCKKRRAVGHLMACPVDPYQWCYPVEVRQDNASGPGE